MLTARGGAGIGGNAGSGSGDTGGGCGTVVINNGIVKAYANASGAGIGGGDWGGSGGSVTINGGEVEAVGDGEGAGIGGGSNFASHGTGGTVAINGGVVTATGGGGNGVSPGGAGIGGGGYGGSGCDVTISGGIVTAKGGGFSAGIGSGGGGIYYEFYPHFVSGEGGTAAISGGTVTATGGSGASGIGGGKDSPGGTVYISGGSVRAKGNNGVAGGAEDIGHGLEVESEHLNSGTLFNKPSGEGGVPVFLTTVTLDGVGAVTRVTMVMTGLTPEYGAKDMYTDKEGKLYLYLPADTKTAAAAAETGEPPEQTAYTAAGRPIITRNDHSAAGTLYEGALPIAVTFASATADGAAGTTTSTRIDLVFSKAVAGLTEEDITITDGTGSAIKGALTGSGTAWSIALSSVVTEGTISVAVSAPAGYIIYGSPRTATVYKAPPETVATPAFSPAEGTYDSVQSVTISCLTTGATIRYTTDGSDPTGSSAEYTGAISVGVTQIIKAKAFKGGMTESAIASAAYTINIPPATHTITATAGTGGSISPSGAVTVNEGEGQIFTIEPDEHYRIETVTVDGHAVGATGGYTFSNVTADHTIAVMFSKITHTITATAGTGGSITPSGAVTVNEGSEQTFTIAADAGYEIDSVTVDGVVQDPVVLSYTFDDVDADHTISATFKRITHIITATAGTGGSITPPGAVTVNEGDEQTFTIAANTNYSIASVTVDGVNKGAISSYAFVDVRGNHTISATFAYTSGGGSEPAYIFRTLTESASGVIVSGIIHEDARLTVSPLKLHHAGTCTACDAIRAQAAPCGYLHSLRRDPRGASGRAAGARSEYQPDAGFYRAADDFHSRGRRVQRPDRDHTPLCRRQAGNACRHSGKWKSHFYRHIALAVCRRAWLVGF